MIGICCWFAWNSLDAPPLLNELLVYFDEQKATEVLHTSGGAAPWLALT